MSGVELVAMRLEDMHRMHPRQVEMTCSKCGSTVGVYPSGQRALKAYPGAKVVCVPCAYLEPLGVGFTAPAASLAEIAQERRDSFDVGKA